MCLISSSEIQKQIIFKVHAPRHGLFLSSSNISAFCPAFPPPTHAGLPSDRHIAIRPRQSSAGLIFYPSRTANANSRPHAHKTPSLSRRPRLRPRQSFPVLSFIRPERQTQIPARMRTKPHPCVAGPASVRVSLSPVLSFIHPERQKQIPARMRTKPHP